MNLFVAPQVNELLLFTVPSRVWRSFQPSNLQTTLDQTGPFTVGLKALWVTAHKRESPWESVSHFIFPKTFVATHDLGKHFRKNCMRK